MYTLTPPSELYMSHNGDVPRCISPYASGNYCTRARSFGASLVALGPRPEPIESRWRSPYLICCLERDRSLSKTRSIVYLPSAGELIDQHGRSFRFRAGQQSITVWHRTSENLPGIGRGGPSEADPRREAWYDDRQPSASVSLRIGSFEA